MPIAGVWPPVTGTLASSLLLSAMCMCVGIGMLLAGKRFTLGSVMFAIVGLAILFAGSLRHIGSTEQESGLFEACFRMILWVAWLGCVGTYIAPKPVLSLTNVQRELVNARILA